MATPFKVLIAYDGSPCATAMLEGLAVAGLPDDVEAFVLSVAERWLPPPSIYEVATSPDPARGLAAAQSLVESAGRTVQAHFPDWIVHQDASAGSPAKTILEKSKVWQADLIVVGSVGHTVFERLLIGSVAHKVANEAHCSVRVDRSPGHKSQFLLVAHDGQPASDRAVKAVARRRWKQGTRAQLTMAVGFGPPPPGEFMLPQDNRRAVELLAPSRDLLKTAGLDASIVIREGDPKNVLVEEASRAWANCIFCGDNDETLLDRILLGTVSNALISRAPCSVEIVR
jgi:nucleotide-binding universal stress UspA family protein